MPNWCWNELCFIDYVHEGSFYKDRRKFDDIVNEVLDFLKETDENFAKRVNRLVKEKAHSNIIVTFEEVAAGLERLKFDFNNLVPYPEELEKQDMDYYDLNKEEYEKKYPTERERERGYRWRLTHWGAKWNLGNEVTYFPEKKILFFDTAWTPVFPILSALHKRFPLFQMEYEYYEQGSGVIGGCSFIPEKYWDSSDYSLQEVASFTERKLQYKEMPPLSNVWLAGACYNPWSMEYMGFKGG